MATTMVAEYDDNEVDGDGATVDDDGDGAMGDNGDDNDNGDEDGKMGSSAISR